MEVQEEGEVNKSNKSRGAHVLRLNPGTPLECVGFTSLSAAFRVFMYQRLVEFTQVYTQAYFYPVPYCGTWHMHLFSLLKTRLTSKQHNMKQFIFVIINNLLTHHNAKTQTA